MSDLRNHKILDKRKIDREKRLLEKKRKEMKLKYAKTNNLRFLCILVLVGLIVRIGYIKFVHGFEYERASVVQATNQSVEQIITPSRGDIVDRNGKLLVSSTASYLVYIDITVIETVDNNESKIENKNRAKNDVAIAFEKLLGIDRAETLARFTGSSEVNNYTVIKKDLTYSQAKEIRNYKTEEGRSLVGVHLEESNKRYYTYKNLAAQTLGFISGDGGNDNWGLENYYDSDLTGTAGRYFTSYDTNKSVIFNEIEPIKGNTLSLTLDYELQQFTDELVAKYGIQHDADNASIIVMVPDSGEILAMSEFATFNSNSPGNIELINDPNFKPEYESLEEDDPKRGEMIYKIWKNFNVSNTFEPGSIYKPLVVAAALEENTLSENDVFDCNGYTEYHVDGEVKRIRCWIYKETGGGHGRQSVEQVLANSCNVGMMKIGENMGRKIFSKYQLDFGVGSKTGIDLPGEEDASNLMYSVEDLNIIELVTGSFGQGFNMTALQSIVAFNSVINGGYVYRPYLVSQIIDSEGKIVKQTEPGVLKKVISKNTSDYVRKILASVVNDGTGQKLAIDGYSIGGKTATGEQGDRESGQYTVAFVGYLPVDNPKYIAIGVIDKPSDYLTNRTSAVPMMRELFLKMINYYNIPSDIERTASSDSSRQAFLSDYTGNKVVDVVKELNNKNYDFILVGSGDLIKSQMPLADSLLTDTTNIFLYLEESEEPVTLLEIPNLVGLSKDLAIEALESLNFNYVIIQDTIEGEPEGEANIEKKLSVKSQMPVDGAKIPIGTEIRIVVE